MAALSLRIVPRGDTWIKEQGREKIPPLRAGRWVDGYYSTEMGSSASGLRVPSA
jgi:hypothetical protein